MDGSPHLQRTRNMVSLNFATIAQRGYYHTHFADIETEPTGSYMPTAMAQPPIELGWRLWGRQGEAHTAASSFLSASRRPSSPSPVRQDSSRWEGTSGLRSGPPGGSRSDLFSTSKRRWLFPLGLRAIAGVTTVSKKLQLDGEARSEASSTARMRSACSSLREQGEPTEE